MNLFSKHRRLCKRQESLKLFIQNLLLLLFVFMGSYSSGFSRSVPGGNFYGASAQSMSFQTPDSILLIMKDVADWQIDSIERNGWRHPECDWTNGALYGGLLALADLSDNGQYYRFMKEQVGEKFDWQLSKGKNRYHADYYCVGQMYCRLYEIYKEPRMIADLKLLADTLLARPHTESLEWKNNIGLREWAWCDALFMAPPSLAMLFRVTGEQKYLDLTDKLWWKTTDYLYDPYEQLYFRDSSFFPKQEKNGKKVFWSRGNGWVMGGLVRVLGTMPNNYPTRDRWIRLYREMAAKVASLQQADGTWHASLLDPESYPSKETSGTGFYCYALAWGINQGLLDAKTYGPVAWKAWRALVNCVHPEGKLGYVQRIGAKPDLVSYDDTEVYGVGAFLLAGSEMYKIAEKAIYGNARLINEKDNGYQGIWYNIGGAGQKGPVTNEYRYKYSGGLGTYPANHYPFSVYSKKVNKTFFCYGGTDDSGKTLYHMVSYFDHNTGEVPRPTIVLDKATNDAHDNPVIQVDKDGYIWLFSTSHGTGRPSFIHRSRLPYDITKFDRISATKIVNGKKVPMDNFSYLQMYYSEENGFVGLFTHYEKIGGRVIAWMTSPDGINWSEWKDLSLLGQGQYQTSGNQDKIIGTAFNYHPDRAVRGGLDFRTNLYYLQSKDFGKTWETVDGSPVELPLKEVSNRALVHDYDSEEHNVYICDVNFDKKGQPVILYITSKGPMPGPEDGPREWHTARWTGKRWEINPFTTSGNNYDMGSIYIEKNRNWVVIAPTETGPQPYNTGGEMTMWKSKNQGKAWKKVKQLTSNSEFNHTYARRPVNVHPGFYAFWADGHGRQPSKSHLYFSDKEGNVFVLPEKMTRETEKPLEIK